MKTHKLPAYHRTDVISIVSPELLLKSQDTYKDTYRKILTLDTNIYHNLISVIQSELK